MYDFEYREEDYTEARALLESILVDSIENVRRKYNPMVTAFSIFDWVTKNIRYDTAERETQFPSETIKSRVGDCDDQVMLLNLMLNYSTNLPTRIIRTSTHAFLQIRVGRVYEYDKRITDIIYLLEKNYKFTHKNAFNLALESTWIDNTGLWFTLDTTARYPGKGCTQSEMHSSNPHCKVSAITFLQ